jgi:hypothetical protein
MFWFIIAGSILATILAATEFALAVRRHRTAKKQRIPSRERPPVAAV